MKAFTDNKQGQSLLERLLKKIKRTSVVAVGILQDEPRKDGFSMVELAAVHEYGSTNGHIPARSFIRSTCDSKKAKHIKLIQKLEERVFKGQLSIYQALRTVGEVVAKDMVQTINAGIKPELKKATKERKKSSKPLIDTGRLKGSITHEVRGAL